MHRATSLGSARFISPQALMAIRNLEFRARVVVEGFWNGLHRSPYHGFSVEFTEYRGYTAGDDLRFLDWRLYARTDRYFVKKFEDETNLRCYLLADNSQSMAYGSTGFQKADYANTLAATLAYFLRQQGDATGLMTFDEQVREYLPARHRTGHLRHLMLALEKPAAGSRTDLVAPLKRAAEIFRKRGLIVLISDLLAPIDALEKSLSNLRACGHDMVIFQLFDPAERDFKFDQASLFRDIESGQQLYIDPAVARRNYLAKSAEHTEAIARTCRKLGISHHGLGTDQPLEVALFDFMRSRMQRGKHGAASRAQRSRAPAA